MHQQLYHSILFHMPIPLPEAPTSLFLLAVPSLILQVWRHSGHISWIPEIIMLLYNCYFTFCFPQETPNFRKVYRIVYLSRFSMPITIPGIKEIPSKYWLNENTQIERFFGFSLSSFFPLISHMYANCQSSHIFDGMPWLQSSKNKSSLMTLGQILRHFSFQKFQNGKHH